MRFIFIVCDAINMPYAIDVTEDTIEQALVSARATESSRPFFQPLFMFNAETGELKRVVRDTDRSFVLIDGAYEHFGNATTPAQLLGRKVVIEDPDPSILSAIPKEEEECES